jgi:hypothetical protein
MKKKVLFLALALVALMGISGFALSEKSVSTPVETAIVTVEKSLSEAPSGTTYGIVGSTPEKYVVNTPIGKYDVEKEKDGGFSCLGLHAKVVSHKGNNYVIDSSLGTFAINLNRCTVVKQ